MEKIFEKDSIPSRMIHRKSFKFEVYFLILTLIGEKTYLEHIYPGNQCEKNCYWFF